jgi:hypothetical protein
LGNGVHIALAVEDGSMVDRFHAALLKSGGSDDGAPGLRPNYDANYIWSVRPQSRLPQDRGDGEVTSTPGLATEGVEHLPDQLLGLGLAERIRAPRRAAGGSSKGAMPNLDSGVLNGGMAEQLRRGRPSLPQLASPRSRFRLNPHLATWRPETSLKMAA